MAGGRLLISSAQARQREASPPATAACRPSTTSGLKAWYSWPCTYLSKPPGWIGSCGRVAARARARWSASRSAKVAPPMRLGVDGKQVSTTSWSRPMISNSWAPRYEATVAMPILLRIFNSPFLMPRR